MQVTSKVFTNKLNKIDNDAFLCLLKTADALKTDLIQSQTMPMDTGDLQKDLDVYDENRSRGSVKVGTTLKYGRRLYYHPEYNFRKDKNPNASGMWFEPYISGKKKNFVKNKFAEFMSGEL